MSDKSKNRKLNDLLRYKLNEMTGEERNAFERHLQRDPFLEEAFEGLNTLSHQEVSDDIKKLQHTIKRRTSRKRSFLYYRIAASLAVLMVISSLYIIITRESPKQMADDSAVEQRTIEILKSDPIKEPVFKDQRSGTNTDPVAQKSVVPGDQNYSRKNKESVPVKITASRAVADIYDKKQETNNVEPEIQFIGDKTEADVSAFRKKTSPAYRAEGRISSSENNNPVSGVIVAVKGSDNIAVTDSAGIFQIDLPGSERTTLVASSPGMESREFNARPDSQIAVIMNPASATITDHVAVGYGAKSYESSTSGLSKEYLPPQPVTGKQNFDKYIEENLHHPDSAVSGQRIVVVISFIVRTDGKIDSIKTIRSPGKQFSEEAIRLIQSGPAWYPALYNGKTIEKEVRLHIVFR